MSNNQTENEYSSEDDDKILGVIKRATADISDQELKGALQESLPGYSEEHIDKLIRTVRPVKDLEIRESNIIDFRKENKLKIILNSIFGNYFFQSFFISIAVAIASARYFRQPDYYYDGRPVTKAVYDSWSKYFGSNTKMELQQFDFTSGIIYGSAVFIICIVFSKLYSNKKTRPTTI
jgi:hypothetical protein